MPMTSRFSKPLLLAVFSAALVLPGLSRPTMSRQQELRVALTARQMAQGGRWLIPEFRDQPRLQKPPLMYWLVAGSFRIAGNTISVPAARFPSAMAGIFLVVTTYWADRSSSAGKGPISRPSSRRHHSCLSVMRGWPKPMSRWPCLPRWPLYPGTRRFAGQAWPCGWLPGPLSGRDSSQKVPPLWHSIARR